MADHSGIAQVSVPHDIGSTVAGESITGAGRAAAGIPSIGLVDDKDRAVARSGIAVPRSHARQTTRPIEAIIPPQTEARAVRKAHDAARPKIMAAIEQADRMMPMDAA